MRSEAEIRAVIADIEYALGLSTDSFPGEGMMKVHINLLQWVLGADNESVVAMRNLHEGVELAKRAIHTQRAAEERKN